MEEDDSDAEEKIQKPRTSKANWDKMRRRSTKIEDMFRFEKVYDDDTHWVDDFSKRLFPVIFLIFNIWFWFYILGADDYAPVADADQYISVRTDH